MGADVGDDFGVGEVVGAALWVGVPFGVDVGLPFTAGEDLGLADAVAPRDELAGLEHEVSVEQATCATAPPEGLALTTETMTSTVPAKKTPTVSAHRSRLFWPLFIQFSP
jgi:hypothetical protein